MSARAAPTWSGHSDRGQEQVGADEEADGADERAEVDDRDVDLLARVEREGADGRQHEEDRPDIVQQGAPPVRIVRWTAHRR